MLHNHVKRCKVWSTACGETLQLVVSAVRFALVASCTLCLHPWLSVAHLASMLMSYRFCNTTSSTCSMGSSNDLKRCHEGVVAHDGSCRVAVQHLHKHHCSVARVLQAVEASHVVYQQVT